MVKIHQQNLSRSAIAFINQVSFYSHNVLSSSSLPFSVCRRETRAGGGERKVGPPKSKSEDSASLVLFLNPLAFLSFLPTVHSPIATTSTILRDAVSFSTFISRSVSNLLQTLNADSRSFPSADASTDSRGKSPMISPPKSLKRRRTLSTLALLPALLLAPQLPLEALDLVRSNTRAARPSRTIPRKNENYKLSYKTLQELRLESFVARQSNRSKRG